MNVPDPSTTRAGAVRLQPLNSYDCWRLVTDAAGPDGIARIVWSGPDGPSIVPMNFTVRSRTASSGSRPPRTHGWRGSAATNACWSRSTRSTRSSHTGWSVVVTGVATCLPPATDPGILGTLLGVATGTRATCCSRSSRTSSPGRQLRRHG